MSRWCYEVRGILTNFATSALGHSGSYLYAALEGALALGRYCCGGLCEGHAGLKS